MALAMMRGTRPKRWKTRGGVSRKVDPGFSNAIRISMRPRRYPPALLLVLAKR